jgi:hypothetical protein
MISGIGWVSELIERAGADVFAASRSQSLGEGPDRHRRRR